MLGSPSPSSTQGPPLFLTQLHPPPCSSLAHSHTLLLSNHPIPSRTPACCCNFTISHFSLLRAARSNRPQPFPHPFLVRSADPDRPQPFHEAHKLSDRTGEFEAERNSPPTPKSRRRTLFLLDVAPLCYKGKKPQPSAFMGWMKLLFENVTARQPIVAVIDGERGNEYRRRLLSIYKANRNTFVPLTSSASRQTWKGDDADLREAFPHMKAFLDECNVPVVCVEEAEADDVVASLTYQAVQKGMQVTIASPDKDFKQLLCADVQIVAPLADLERWSFYTCKHYFAQYNCDPDIELGLRCMLGDKADSIPGLADLAPGFGRNTAIKLMKKHGSLESLLNAAAIRTVGKPYIQHALTKHATFLRKNIELLRLRRDIPVRLEEEWCTARNCSNDLEAFSKLESRLQELKVQRTLKDGIRTRSFSDRVVIREMAHKTKTQMPKASQKFN